MNNFLPHTDQIRSEMLNSIGFNLIEDLFANINPAVRSNGLNLPDGISELEAKKKLIALADKNLSISNSASFIGGGVYNRYIPACIGNILSRPEFYTAYTPYQPEISQGTLQVMYEYQSMICNLTGMDVANASVYDGGTAAAEAVLMASRLTNKSKAIVASALNPEYKAVIETYCYGEGIEIEYLPLKDNKSDITLLENKVQSNEYACILIQNPNYLGSIEDVFEIAKTLQGAKTKLITCVDPVTLAVLKSPSEYKADIVVGDIQPLGLGMNYGGPHCGFISCKTEYARQLPGRIAGMTKDKNGKTAFTLTLQAREQHIRRAKATSNICSNQALMALAATVYLSAMGPMGLKEAANISAQRAHYLAEKIDEIAGFKVIAENFLYEFVLKVENINIDELLKELEANNILGGIKLEGKFTDMKDCLLVCATEMNSVEDINRFIDCLKEISAKKEILTC